MLWSSTQIASAWAEDEVVTVSRLEYLLTLYQVEKEKNPKKLQQQEQQGSQEMRQQILFLVLEYHYINPLYSLYMPLCEILVGIII